MKPPPMASNMTRWPRLIRPSATANGPRKPCSANPRMALAKAFDSSLHGLGLDPDAARPPIGLRLVTIVNQASAMLKASYTISKVVIPSCASLESSRPG